LKFATFLALKTLIFFSFFFFLCFFGLSTIGFFFSSVSESHEEEHDEEHEQFDPHELDDEDDELQCEEHEDLWHDKLLRVLFITFSLPLTDVDSSGY